MLVRGYPHLFISFASWLPLLWLLGVWFDTTIESHKQAIALETW